MTTNEELPPVSRHGIPRGVDKAAAWSWRLLLIAAALWGILWFLTTFSEVSVPIAIALLGTALVVGAVDRLHRWGVPRAVGALGAVFGVVAFLAAAIGLIGQQLSTQFDDLRDSVVEGIGQIQDWATNGPLGLSDQQLTQAIDQLQTVIASSGDGWLDQATQVGTQVTHFVAGFFIVLFAMFFFLYEGDRIWGWAVSFLPASMREQVAVSGRVAWGSLTAFVRATVLVALVDAIGIMLVAFLLDVPLAGAIGVLVFIGAFIPIIGALVSGLVAVLVALVAHGPIVALLMLAGVVLVQQLESHVLQPFIMGRFVAIHPLAIIVVIAMGIVAGGIVGALLAVPAAAVFNSVVKQMREAAAAGVGLVELAELSDPPAEPSA